MPSPLITHALRCMNLMYIFMQPICMANGEIRAGKKSPSYEKLISHALAACSRTDTRKVNYHNLANVVRRRFDLQHNSEPTKVCLWTKRRCQSIRPQVGYW